MLYETILAIQKEPIPIALNGSLKTYGLADAKRSVLAIGLFHGSIAKHSNGAHEMAETRSHDAILGCFLIFQERGGGILD
jgi:hypothetical protein